MNSTSSSGSLFLACTNSQSRCFRNLCVSSLLHAFNVRPEEFALRCCGAEVVAALEEAEVPAIARALASFLFSGVAVAASGRSHSMGAYVLANHFLPWWVVCAWMAQVGLEAGGRCSVPARVLPVVRQVGGPPQLSPVPRQLRMLRDHNLRCPARRSAVRKP